MCRAARYLRSRQMSTYDDDLFRAASQVCCSARRRERAAGGLGVVGTPNSADCGADLFFTGSDCVTARAYCADSASFGESARRHNRYLQQSRGHES